VPSKEFERAVYAALILAGEPINHRRLAELMDCSPGEASRRVAQLEGVIRKARGDGGAFCYALVAAKLSLLLGSA
jgi:chromosome segregation and condensation protein ScpB